MATYVISDLHGNYEGYRKILEKINFHEKDALYVNGDVVDRGSGSIKILEHMMMQPNIYPILGNHEYIACQCLAFLMQEINDDTIAQLDDGKLEGFLQWQKIGGDQTIREFQTRNRTQQEAVIEYLKEFSLYEEITVKDASYVIVHAGLDHFASDRPLSDYHLHELLFHSPDYGQVYYPDRYLITGHLPTRSITGNELPDHIYIANRHIAIDCGSGYGGQIGAICLESGVQFYSDE